MKIEISGSPGAWQLFAFIEGRWKNLTPDRVFITKAEAHIEINKLKKLVDGHVILPADGVKTDFDSTNGLTGKYNSKSYQPRTRVPIKLVKAAIKEFREFCAMYHIDSTKYKYVQPCQIEGAWRQFDFQESEDRRNAVISMHSIICRDENCEIVQRVFELGR